MTTRAHFEAFATLSPLVKEGHLDQLASHISAMDAEELGFLLFLVDCARESGRTKELECKQGVAAKR